MKIEVGQHEEGFSFVLTPETLAEASLVTRIGLQTKLGETYAWDKGLECYITLPRYRGHKRYERIKK